MDETTRVGQFGSRATNAPPVSSPSPAAPRPGWEPPLWLLAALAAAYVVAFGALVFWPDGTLIERLRALDGGICAQAPSHSFFPAGEQLPLCSRNTGIYIGFACATLTLLASGRIRAANFPGRWVMLPLGVAVAFMAEDGVNSFLNDLGAPHLYSPQNIVRLFSGLGTGVAMAAFLLPVANTLLWLDEDERSTFARLGDLLPLAAGLSLAFLAIASQAPQLLYPVSLLSSAGLVCALALVNLVFALGLSNRAGNFTGWRQAFPLLTAMIALAVVELILLFHLKEAALSALQR